MDLDTHELAWAAGFFDGEGSISCSETKRVHSNGRALKLGIAQVDPRPLERFVKIFGIGKVNGPYNPSSKGRPYYEFATTKFEDVQAVIGMLWKFLSPPKREKAKEALLKYRNLGNRPHGNIGWHRGVKIDANTSVGH